MDADDPPLDYYILGPLSTDARFGYSLAAGDFNRDGFVDLAVGAPRDSPYSDWAENVGAVNVIYGSASGLSTRTNRPWLLAGNSPNGADPYDAFGFALAAGDFNGDTFDDLAVGVPREALGGIPNAGAVTVFYGKARGFLWSASQSWDQDSPGVEGGIEPDDEFG